MITEDFEYAQASMALAAMGRRLHGLQWLPATSGNLSLRLRNGDIAITASGRDKSTLAAEDIMCLDARGKPRDDRRPSAETGLHLHLYQRDPNIGAVLHVHSPNAVLASMVAASGLHLRGLELLKVFPGVDTHEAELFVPVFANRQDMLQLAQDIESCMARQGQGHAYLLAGHGLYTWADELQRCFHQLEALDQLLGIYLGLHALGGRS